jgi:hypothetical protein
MGRKTEAVRRHGADDSGLEEFAFPGSGGNEIPARAAAGDWSTRKLLKKVHAIFREKEV